MLSYEPRPLDDDESVEMESFVALIDTIVSSVDVSDVSSLPDAEIYDSHSIEDFVISKVKSETVRHEISTFFESVLSCDVSDCSFLFALWYLASSGGLETLGDNTPTSSQMYVLGDPAGPSEICSRLARRLREDAGVTFFTAARATSVNYVSSDEIVLETDDRIITCRRCVFAMNPALAFATIRFDPELPLEKKNLGRNVLSGHVIKIYLCYDRPFWDGDANGSGESRANDRGVNRDNDIDTVIDRGRSNLAVSEMFPAKNIFYSKKIGGHHSIVALITGKTCMSVLGMTECQRKDLLLKQLRDMYPEVEGSIIDRPVAYLEKNWCADALSGGCFTNGYRSFIGVRSALQTPLDGRVFFASSETSDDFCGYMEGALSAGDRVSDMILKSLDSSKQFSDFISAAM